MDSCIKWSTDYFLAAHQSGSELVGQVGDGEADHAWWGRPEEMTMARYHGLNLPRTLEGHKYCRVVCYLRGIQIVM